LDEVDGDIASRCGRNRRQCGFHDGILWFGGAGAAQEQLRSGGRGRSRNRCRRIGLRSRR
jgi:hypothetical protein